MHVVSSDVGRVEIDKRSARQLRVPDNESFALLVPTMPKAMAL
jgi:hypothetical protein